MTTTLARRAKLATNQFLFGRLHLKTDTYHTGVGRSVATALPFNRCLFATQGTSDGSASDLIGLPRANKYRTVQLPLAVDVVIEPSRTVPSLRALQHRCNRRAAPHRTAPWSPEARIRLPYQPLSTRALDRPRLHLPALGHSTTTYPIRCQDSNTQRYFRLWSWVVS